MVPEPDPSPPLPSEVSGYRIVPISLPPLPTYPVSATHYLYLRPHEPKLPTPAAARSLFLVNVPFDSTEFHLKRLLSVQLGLPSGRIEEVLLEESKRIIEGPETPVVNSQEEKKGRKRKRSSDRVAIEELDGTALPATWDRELRTNGQTAIVVFVDRLSLEAAYKAAKKVQRCGTIPIWGDGMEGNFPSLGIASMLLASSLCPY